MDDRPSCCSGFGCVVGLVIVLCAIGYLVYTQRHIVPVYRAGSVQETMNEVKKRNEEGRPYRPLVPTAP